MKRSLKAGRPGFALLMGAGLLLLAGSSNRSGAYPRYNDAGAGGGCSDCHGLFTGGTSPKGTVFPANSKHEMHNGSTSMATECNLCHSAGDTRNPYTYTSTGTANNTGRGCAGCHVGAGLRAHHVAKGVTLCYDCHLPEASDPENVKPPYYGTVDTKADHPENLVAAANTNENWSVGDFMGLDNDGNTLYDAADFACSPYRILSVTKEGNNVRITWQTAGGRTDAIQASRNVVGTYSNVSSALPITGVGVVTTNYVEVGGATNAMRFYRLKFSP